MSCVFLAFIKILSAYAKNCIYVDSSIFVTLVNVLYLHRQVGPSPITNAFHKK